MWQAQKDLRTAARCELEDVQNTLRDTETEIVECRNIIKADKEKVKAGLWPERMLHPFATKLRAQLLGMATADARSDCRNSLEQLSQHTATEWEDSRPAACPALVMCFNIAGLLFVVHYTLPSRVPASRARTTSPTSLTPTSAPTVSATSGLPSTSPTPLVPISSPQCR